MQIQKNRIPKMVEPLKTGDLLVQEGLIHHNDIDMALSIQAKQQDAVSLKKNRLLGMILCDLNLITPMDNYYVLHKYNKLMSIQSALVSKQIISRELVLKAEKESEQQNIPFISVLLKKQFVSMSELQKLLFDLFHIPFRSISNFIFNEKDRNKLVEVMDKFQSFKTGIIPMVLKDNTVLFGITDPENLLLLRKLNNQYPQYRFKALFIPFSGFSWFYEIIYEDCRKKEPSRVKPLDLSFLLGFKASVKNPGQEKEIIQTLYERYELLRQLTGKPKRASLQNEFYEFIVQTHGDITKEYKSQIIEFSLNKDDKNVNIMAFPKR